LHIGRANGSGTATAAELARSFAGVRKDKVQELFETLASLSQARAVEDGRFAA
jgi:hypothetical protein